MTESERQFEWVFEFFIQKFVSRTANLIKSVNGSDYNT